MIIVGLGNKGLEYRNTRHNIGFMVIGEVAKKLNLTFKKSECKSLTATYYVKGKPQVLAKPQTYMNLSGQSVKELMGKYKESIDNVVVICDDIDLPIGSIRIRKSGSGGTHNGLKNIISETGSKEFIRIRIGVGAKPNKEMDLADYVLGRFSKMELEELTPSIERAAEGIIELIEGKSIDQVMQKYNFKP